MSDDEADPELLALLRESLGIGLKRSEEVSEDTGVLKDAEYIYRNSIDVVPDMLGTKSAALQIHKLMQERSYSTAAWSQHDFHPSPDQGFSNEHMVNFIFTMDLLNFSFWSEKDENERFQVEYQGQRCAGYKSLVASLRRGLEEGVPITTPSFWRSEEATEEVYKSVFRSATDEKMPMLEQRIAVLREAAEALHESFPDPDEIKDVDETVEDTLSTADRDLAHTPGEETTTQAASEPISQEPAPEVAATKIHEEATRDTSEQTEQINVEEDTATTTAAIDHSVLGVEETQPAAPKQLDSRVEAVPPPNKILRHHLLPPDYSAIRLIQSADHSAGKLVNLLAKHFPSFRDEARFDGRRVRFLKRAQIFVADLWAAFQGTGYGEFRDIGHLTMFADYRVPQMLNSLGVLNYSPSLHYRIRDRVEISAGHSWEVQLRGCSIWAVELIRREIVSMNPETEVNAVVIDFFLYDMAKEREKQGAATATGGGLGMPHHRTRSIWY